MLRDILKNSATGADHIRYAMLRNLKNEDLERLVDTLKELNGTLPQT